jgi:hypothetical protein
MLLGSRFAHDVVVNGGFAVGPFLHAVSDLPPPIAVQLKNNLGDLSCAVEQRCA